MADQKITELPIKGTSSINLADYLLGIDSSEGYQMLISDLAKKIIESYTGSSIAGSSQALKTALDDLATNTAGNLATVESSTTASKAYAVGDYLVLGGVLYKVTSAISSGSTITVGTNVVAAAIADDVSDISNKIGNTTMGTTATTITGAIAEHEGDISTLNSNLSNKIIVEAHDSDTVESIASGSTAWLGVQNVAKTGYKIVSIAGYYLQGGNGTGCNIYALYPNQSGTGVGIAIRNMTSSAATNVYVTLYLLYLKN